MLVRVEVLNRRGSLLQLPLTSIDEGISVEKIEGLDPVKAVLVSSNFAGQDGAQYHNARRETRNLKFKLGIDPDYVEQSALDIRNRLYSYFMPKSEVLLRFVMASGFFVEIQGQIETFDCDPFVEEPEADISITCFKPDFIDPRPKKISGMTSTTLTTEEIEYEGTVETGILFELRPDRSLSSFTIYHTRPDGSLRQMDFAYPFQAGDKLSVNTVRGSKYAILKRANTDISVMWAIPSQQKWIELEEGSNEIRVYASGAPIPWDLTRTDRYGGL